MNRWHSKSIRGWALTLGVLVLVAWLLVQLFGPYSQLKNRAKWLVGVDRLQSWAVSALENRPPPAVVGPQGAIDVNFVPADIRELADGCFIVVLEAHDDVEEHVHFACGGGFYHYGLCVGRPGFKPAPSRSFQLEELADGVWGLYER